MGGVPLAYDEWGDRQGRMVVLLHGSGQTRHSWKSLGQRLAAEGLHVVAYDTRGHGDSGWASNGDYGVDVEIADLQCVLRAVDGQQPVLVGASRGGGTSLLAVGEGHVDAAALVLVDIAPHIEAEGTNRVRAFMRQAPEGFNSLEEVAHAIASYQPQRTRPRSLHGLAKNVRRGADGRYYWHWDPQSLLSPDTLRIRRERMEASSHQLKVPTLLMRGAESDVLSDEGVRRFLANSPRAEFVSVKGAAHMVAGDRNDQFADAIMEFVTRAPCKKRP